MRLETMLRDPGLRPRLDRRSVVSVVAVFAMLSTSFSVATSVQAGTTDGPAFALFVAPDSAPYQRLDPATLADLTDAPPLDFGWAYPDWAISADGSTVVLVVEQRTIIVYDGLVGVERTRFEAPVAVSWARLGANGQRLVLSVPRAGSPSGITPEQWYVFDTRDGRLISTVETESAGIVPGGFPAGLIDSTAERLYRFEAGDDGPGPWSLRIVSHDLATGAEIGRLTLPDVLAGERYDRAIDQVPVADVLTPAVALSPNGARLAVVDAETDELTTVDTASLTVEQTVPLSRRDGVVRRALTWLGILPQDVSAKYMDGRFLKAVFSPDGQRLYLHGLEGEVGDQPDESSERGLGLTAVDVATGEIVATALDGQVLETVVPAPDGRSVYVNGPTVPWSEANGEPGYRLTRLDASSLDTLADREFASRRPRLDASSLDTLAEREFASRREVVLVPDLS
jgi:hypothetical protein